MTNRLGLLTFVFMILPLCAISAPDFSGTWKASTQHQYVLKITSAGPEFHGDFYNLGPEQATNTLDGNPISSIGISGQKITFSLDRAVGTFEGALSSDGSSITGT
jgi:hypothetical protein